VTATLFDEIDAVAHDWRPSRVESREAIRLAILRAAGDEGGLVHAATVRKHLPAWVNPQQVGATVCALVRAGYLIPTGHYRPNGQEQSRNRTKASPVRRLVRFIPPEAVR